MLTRKTDFFRLAVLTLAAFALQACAALGIQADTFNERTAVAYSTVSAIRDSAGSLLDAGTISAAEAQNVQDQANNMRAAIDLARVVEATDPTQAAAKLSATLAGLQALSDYLRGLQ